MADNKKTISSNNKFLDIKEDLEQANREAVKSNSFLPKQVINDKRKNYTFTLTETERELLTQISRKQGYKSDSKFIGDLILGLAKEE